MLGEIRRHFRDATWAVRVPRRLKDLHVELSGATEFLASTLRRAPTPEELAAHLNVGVDDILEAIEAGGGYRPATLDATPSDDDDRRPAQSAALHVVDVNLEGTEDRVLVQRLLATLPERERRILELRFFEELSQAEIAELVGVSQVHVSRLLRSSLTDLQRAARADSDAESTMSLGVPESRRQGGAARRCR